MSPVFPGLSITRCRVRHRWDISAKPRSPWYRRDRSSALRVFVSGSSSPRAGLFHRDVDARAGALVPGIGQEGQVLQVGPRLRQDVLTGGGQVMGAAGQHVRDPQRHATRRDSACTFPAG